MIQDHLNSKDFVNIRFIDWELKWTTREDFIKYGKIIKQVYQKMNYNQKQIYKWYCYANIHTNQYQKNKIWDYLNDSLEYKECIIALSYDGKNYVTREEI